MRALMSSHAAPAAPKGAVGYPKTVPRGNVRRSPVPMAPSAKVGWGWRRAGWLSAGPRRLAPPTESEICPNLVRAHRELFCEEELCKHPRDCQKKTEKHIQGKHWRRRLPAPCGSTKCLEIDNSLAKDIKRGGEGGGRRRGCCGEGRLWRRSNAAAAAPPPLRKRRTTDRASCSSQKYIIYLVDPASSHMLVSKIKPCMCQYTPILRQNREWLIKSVMIH